ncbi:MAG TPA: hypothetical protein PKK12_10720 [Candidatus Aminicenantes bacterium]|nr:hypothetical protein [Candidatus Aminicenantes bacterium]
MPGKTFRRGRRFAAASSARAGGPGSPSSRPLLRLLTLFLLGWLVAALFPTSVHVHADGHPHGDCQICCLSILPAECSPAPAPVVDIRLLSEVLRPVSGRALIHPIGGCQFTRGPPAS